MRKFEHSYPVFHIRSFYASLFASAYKIQRDPNQDYAFVIEMMKGAALAIELAQEIETSVSPGHYESLFVDDPTKHRSDMMEALVEIVVEALEESPTNSRVVTTRSGARRTISWATCSHASGTNPMGSHRCSSEWP